jgi:protein-S-isoprenylcysteine O-methyltransferase Ste14
MNRALLTFMLVLIALWVIAHMLYPGPVAAATETAITWITGFAAGSTMVAALTVLLWGVAAGQSSPAWRRFLGQARTVAFGLGLALVIFGGLHWRDTEPRNELHWVVLGCVVLSAGILVHGWLSLCRSHLSGRRAS